MGVKTEGDVTKPSFTLSFKKSKNRRFSSPFPDYIVLFNERRVGQLTSGDSGYIGLLPDYAGRFISFPEADIHTWDMRRREMNAAATQLIHDCRNDTRRIERISESLDPKVMRLNCGDEEKTVSSHAIYFAQSVFGSVSDIPWGYLTEITPEPLPSLSSADNLAQILSRNLTEKTALYEFLYQISSGLRPRIEDRDRDDIHEELSVLTEHASLGLLASASLVWFEDAYPETLNGGLHRFLREVQRHNVWTSSALSKDPDYEKNSSSALKVEDLLANLRNTVYFESQNKPLQRSTEFDLPATTRLGLASLFETCMNMGKASPLRSIDKELVFIFHKMVYKKA